MALILKVRLDWATKNLFELHKSRWTVQFKLDPHVMHQLLLNFDLDPENWEKNTLTQIETSANTKVKNMKMIISCKTWLMFSLKTASWFHVVFSPLFEQTDFKNKPMMVSISLPAKVSNEFIANSVCVEPVNVGTQMLFRSIPKALWEASKSTNRFKGKEWNSSGISQTSKM